MRIIVVHEDGDRSSRVALLAQEVTACVASGSMQYQGVDVEVRHEFDM
ncbi:hypothetical protein SEA_HERBERTWM_32 [Mycobacterium phage Herbertwm]|nr:hypothetical protein SEA_HERBERTWM_32 [Mycobacterium phage Herbertwm]